MSWFVFPVDLLGLLKWRSNTSLLQQNLRQLMKVEGGEVVKVRTGHYLPKWVAVSRQGSGFKIGFQACVRSSKTGSKFGLPFWIRV